MDNEPLVSLIIPTYNAENFIIQCLETIFKQSYKNIEIIVVDDGSQDRTAEILGKYKNRIIYLYQHPSGGPASPRNAGIARSRGDYLCFFDSDDLMTPDCISHQVEFLKRHTDAGMVFCDYRNFNAERHYENSHFQTCPQLSRLLDNRREMVLQNPCKLLAEENFGIMGTLMIRCSMLQHEPGFNENLYSSVDFYFYYKLARFSPVGINNHLGQLRRLHDNNITSNQVQVLRMRICGYSLLVETEQNREAKALLRNRVSDCWSDLSRYYANRHDYRQSFQNEWQALLSNFCFSQSMRSLKSFVRTVSIATGLHRPQEEAYQFN